MRPIRWLHISDLHMRPGDAWSQDVVLQAMCEHISSRRDHVAPADFVLVSGDLGFSGKQEEYELVGRFIDDLSLASGVEKERIFCVPGNHDIDRDRQRMCFHGARSRCIDQNTIDLLLGPTDDLSTLLERQECFRSFATTYFAAQKRSWTEDRLAYVSHLAIENVNVAIIGLDSAWLSEGGPQDHLRLLVGERQVINALKLVAESAPAPHIVVAMCHHPLHLLQECDHQPILIRLERECHLFHYGHLHEVATSPRTLAGGACLMVGAGACYETRQTRNSYAMVTVDLLAGRRKVEVMRYEPKAGEFRPEEPEQFEFEVRPRNDCPLGGLADAIAAYHQAAAPMSHYLSALLLRHKDEFAMLAERTIVFGPLSLAGSQGEGDLNQRTSSFMAVRNIIRALYDGSNLTEILGQHGGAVASYADHLITMQHDPTVAARFAQLEDDARKFAGVQPQSNLSHTMQLMAELVATNDWAELTRVATRHVDSPDGQTATKSRRLLALALANTEGAEARAASMDIYERLLSQGSAEPTDFANLTGLYLAVGRDEDANLLVREALQKLPPGEIGHILEVGHAVVAATGDRDLRAKLTEAIDKGADNA